jgi:hypothetical protein
MTLAVAATATATAAAVGTTAFASSAATPLAGPGRFGAHELVAPSPVAVPRHVVAKPRAAAPAPVKAAPSPRPTVHRTHRAVAPRPAPSPTRSTTLTPQQRLDRAVAALPNFRTGDAVFVLKPGLGSWGLTDMGAGIVYVSPTVPANRMYSVVAHEWGHVLSAKPYKPDVMAGVTAMNAWFGGSGLTGAERAADCIARILGATWTNYTACNDAHWRDGARKLLAHQQL